MKNLVQKRFSSRGAAYRTPAPADWQPTPNRCKRPWGIDPRGWSMVHRITGESDRRHLSRGPMPAAIEQSWPYASYPGQPAPSISIANQSKRLHVELPHQGQQPAASKQRARGGGARAGGGVVYDYPLNPLWPSGYLRPPGPPDLVAALFIRGSPAFFPLFLFLFRCVCTRRLVSSAQEWCADVWKAV